MRAMSAMLIAWLSPGRSLVIWHFPKICGVSTFVSCNKIQKNQNAKSDVSKLDCDLCISLFALWVSFYFLLQSSLSFVIVRPFCTRRDPMRCSPIWLGFVVLITCPLAAPAQLRFTQPTANLGELLGGPRYQHRF